MTSIPLLLLTLSSGPLNYSAHHKQLPHQISFPASAILVIHQYATIPPEANLFDHQNTISITLFYATAPLQNIVTTTLIAYRIWAVDKQTRTARSQNFSLMPALLILVESAAFYSIAELLLLILYLLGMNAQFLLLETLTPIVVSSSTVTRRDERVN